MEPVTEAILNQFKTNVIGNYGRFPLTLTRGEGTRVWDEHGNEYLDFISGIAVNALGHCHPHWVKRLQEQAAKLVHATNLFYIPQQGELAVKLVQRAGPGKLLFCNSGAEASEALLKLARLHGRRRCGNDGQCYRVIAADRAFHGRTFGGMAATPQEKIQGGFHPMLDGFAFGKINDIDSFVSLIDDQTAAILVETIQGEGGIYVCENEFLQDLRRLCDDHELMLIIDEVQCGAARSGTYFAYEEADIRPDAIGMAKGLGGGFPIGAIWVADEFSDLFQPGSHGSTFSGSPLACTAALAVLEVIEEEGLVDRVKRLGAEFMGKLEDVAREFPEHIVEVRGRGFLIAVAMREDFMPFIGELRDRGLLTVGAGTDAIRFLPPLNVDERDLDRAIAIFRSVLSEHE